MTLNRDAKFKEQLNFGFQHDKRNLVNFNPTTQKTENFTSMVPFYPKYITFELKNTKKLPFMTLNNDSKFESPDLVVSKSA